MVNDEFKLLLPWLDLSLLLHWWLKASRLGWKLSGEPETGWDEAMNHNETANCNHLTKRIEKRILINVHDYVRIFSTRIEILLRPDRATIEIFQLLFLSPKWEKANDGKTLVMKKNGTKFLPDDL